MTKIKNKETIKAKTIITSHINADYDALGSMLAAQKLYPDSVIVFPGSQEKNLRDFFISSAGYLFNMADPKSIDLSYVKKLVIVDTKQKNRLPHILPLLKKRDIIIDIYDHHPALKTDIKGDNEVIEKTGATTTLLSSIMQKKNIIPTPDEATIMAMGIYEDTGLFTYSSTTEQDLKQASFLLSCKAKLKTIADFVVKEIKSEQLVWLMKLLENMNFKTINGFKIHFSIITSAFYIPDLASIVQKIIKMENLDTFFAIVLMNNKVHIIARNRLPEINTGKILSKFNGGGHYYAASAKIDNHTLVQVEIKLMALIENQVKNIKIAKTLMTCPAITIKSNTSCKKASKIMARYNINALLIVDKNNSYKGYITRQVIEKTQYHKISKLSVKEYMNSEANFITLDTKLSVIENLILERKHKILPVINNRKIKGVITRTNVLNYLVQNNKERSFEQTLSDNQKNAKKRHINHLLSQRLSKDTIELFHALGQTSKELGFNIYIVGGFVRDLLLNRQTEDIDIVIEGDGIKFAEAFKKNVNKKIDDKQKVSAKSTNKKQQSLKNSCRINTYEKFGTAAIIFDDKTKIDIASARLEYYDTPASLPIVEKSSIKLDLARRDFTINTFAISIHPNNFGTLIDYFGASRDLKEKTIRTIHNLSFVEDPTRVFRAIKFSHRFEFKIGKLTENLIKNAMKINSFKNLRGIRVLSELKQIFEEPDPILSIKTIQKYGLEKIIHKDLKFTPKLYKNLKSINQILTWHYLLYVDEKYPKWAIYFMILFHHCSRKTSEQICKKLQMPITEQNVVLEKRYHAQKKLIKIESPYFDKKKKLYKTLINFQVEYILFMMAIAKKEKTKKAISYFYTHQRNIKPLINGKDLIKIGLVPGPIFGTIFKLILDAKLDGKLETKEKELSFVLRYAQKHKLID